MSSKETPTSEKVYNIVLRDLQSLLRQSINEEVQVIDYKTTALLPPGENYGSSIMKVDATIKRTKESAEEQVHLVAKMMPPSELQRIFLKTTLTFNKEFLVFRKLIDAYRKIEEESGVPTEKLFNILPKFYGGRLSLNENSSEADDDAVLLMENLKASGYYCMSRLNGLDLNHAKLAIAELARFHALGIALNSKKPNLFAEAKESLKEYPFVKDNKKMQALMQNDIDMICSDPRVVKYADQLREKAMIKLEYLQDFEATEPWESIIHGDFWVNNIMFNKENGKLDDVKFVDFQMTQACSPLMDLPHFLCTSLSMEIIDGHFQNLLDTYHTKFVEELEKTGCDLLLLRDENFTIN